MEEEFLEEAFLDFSGKDRSLWITWHEHRRTRSLVEHLRVPVAVYDDHRTLPRYTVGPAWTLGTLLRHRPNVVFTHFSYGLLLFILIYKHVFRLGRVKVIADCHNKALKRRMGGPLGGLFAWFKRAVFRSVDLIVVTNPMVVPVARELCERVTILRDPLTDWQGEDQRARAKAGAVDGHILFICSFDKDEPVDLIFATAQEAARRLGRRVVISGRAPEHLVPEAVRRDENIVLPGFMPLQQYKETLFLAAAVVVLTEDDDCLVCGAYESLGADRPTVLSATPGLQACFGSAAHYCRHSSREIVDRLAEAMAQEPAEEDARRRFQAAWGQEWQAFTARLREVTAG